MTGEERRAVAAGWQRRLQPTTRAGPLVLPALAKAPRIFNQPFLWSSDEKRHTSTSQSVCSDRKAPGVQHRRIDA